MRLIPLFALLLSTTLAGRDAYPPPRFTDPDRVTKLESAMPEVDRIFRAYATDTKIPGMVWGVVIDGRFAHAASTGPRDRASGAKVEADTVGWKTVSTSRRLIFCESPSCLLRRHARTTAERCYRLLFALNTVFLHDAFR